MDSNLTQDDLLLKADQKFAQLKCMIQLQSQQHVRIDLIERSLFEVLLNIGLLLLKALVAGAGTGDEGEQVSPGGRTLRRSENPHQRLYRSIFGVLSVVRWVYRRSKNKRIEYVPTDARLGLPRGECSYVLEEWTERLCVHQTFDDSVSTLADILGHAPSVEAAETMNLRMAEHADAFRLQQSAPAPAEGEIIVATADGTSVPMHCTDRTQDPDARAGSRQGATRRAYIGAVYSILPFVRQPQEVLDELLRGQAAKRRPRPQGKRVWAEMAAPCDGSLSSGSELVFVEMAIDLQARDPDRQQTLVCIMDGEQKLWDLQHDWLGRAVEILDFFHVLSRVRDVSKVAYSNSEHHREAWVSDQLHDLLTGKVDTVIRRWQRLLRDARQTKRWSSEQQQTVDSAIGYFSNNRHRMQYDEYLRQGYPIGSGVAEGTCRNLVKDRMDRTGMHWRLPGARAMLKTRALHLNDEWNDFVEFRIQREQEILYALAA